MAALTRLSCVMTGILMAACQAGPGELICRKVELAGAGIRKFTAVPGTSLEASVPGLNSILVSPAAADRVSVQRAELGTSPTGLARVSLAVSNCTSSPMLLRVRTQFMDESGRRTEPISIWRELVVGPGSVIEVDELAMQPASRGFRVEIDRLPTTSRP
jgi:hypothetical protein